MNQSQIEDQIKQYLLTSFLSEMAPAELDSDADLFLLLDSLQILRLVSQLESWHGIRVDQSELAAENLSSVNKAAAFVVRKLPAGQAAKPPLKVLRAASI